MAIIKQVFRELFKEAEKNGGIHYLFAILRLDGYNYKNPDQLLEQRKIINLLNVNKLSKKDIRRHLKYILSRIEEQFSVIFNLYNCCRQKDHKFKPYYHLYTGDSFKKKNPPFDKLFKEFLKNMNEYKNGELTKIYLDIFDEEKINEILNVKSVKTINQYKKWFRNIRDLTSIFSEEYFSIRMNFTKYPKYIKMRQFQVLELLTNKYLGLYGFHIHFSNGNKATYIRRAQSTQIKY